MGSEMCIRDRVLLVVAIVLELAVLSVIRARTRAKNSGDAV